MRQLTVNGMTWDNEIGTISQLAKPVPGGWVLVYGHAEGLPGAFPRPFARARGTWSFLPKQRCTSGISLCIRGGAGNSAGVQEDKGGWLLKLYKDQKKIMESFIRIAVVLDHIVNDLFNLNIFHKESPYFHKYVIST